jgi:hypothetical protein
VPPLARTHEVNTPGPVAFIAALKVVSVKKQEDPASGLIADALLLFG